MVGCCLFAVSILALVWPLIASDCCSHDRSQRISSQTQTRPIAAERRRRQTDGQLAHSNQARIPTHSSHVPHPHPLPTTTPTTSPPATATSRAPPPPPRKAPVAGRSCQPSASSGPSRSVKRIHSTSRTETTTFKQRTTLSSHPLVAAFVCTSSRHAAAAAIRQQRPARRVACSSRSSSSRSHLVASPRRTPSRIGRIVCSRLPLLSTRISDTALLTATRRQGETTPQRAGRRRHQRRPPSPTTRRQSQCSLRRLHSAALLATAARTLPSSSGSRRAETKSSRGSRRQECAVRCPPAARSLGPRAELRRCARISQATAAQ